MQSTVAASTASANTGVVYIQTPYTYVTSTIGWDNGPAGTVTTSTAAASTASGHLGVVYVETPYPYTTLFTGTDDGPGATRTYSIVKSITDSANLRGTVSVTTPYPYSTRTVAYSSGGILTGGPRTTTIRAGAAGPVGYIEYETQPPVVTQTVGYDGGPAGTTRYSTYTPTSTEAPTAYVSTPFGYITTTAGWDAKSTGTTTIAPGTGTQGTVLIDTPYSGPTVTTTNFVTTGSAYTTTYDNSGTATDTVYIQYVQTYVTITTTSGTTGTTITVTTPVNTTPGTIKVVQPTPNTACGNVGLQYAIQTNIYQRGLQAQDPTYSAFAAAAFHTAAPTATGVTTYVEVPVIQQGASSGAVYGNTISPPVYFGVDHRGYLFAKETGSFQFYFPISDDITLLWVGAYARAGWTRANADIEQLYNSSLAQAQAQYTFRYSMTQGQYAPLRILYANANYAAQFRLTIIAPDGSVVSNGSAAAAGPGSPYLVQYSCDGTTAPQYQAWGHES